MEFTLGLIFGFGAGIAFFIQRTSEIRRGIKALIEQNDALTIHNTRLMKGHMDESTDLFEYLAEIVPQARIICAGCPVDREAGQMVRRGELLYCSDECADRALAVLIKSQPKGVKFDGFSI